MPTQSRRSNLPSMLPLHKSKLGPPSTPSPRPQKTPLTPFHPTRLTTIYEETPSKLPKPRSAKSSSPPLSTPFRSKATMYSSRLPQPSSPMPGSKLVLGNSRLHRPMTPSTHRSALPEPAKTSRYAAAHLDEPCTAGALMHVLKPCGHRLLTVRPELCAANCRQPHPADQFHPNGQFRNPKDITAPFVCPACVDREVKTEVLQLLESWTSFGIEHLHIQKDPGSGVVREVDSTTKVLCERIAAMRASHEVNGRKCHAYEDERMLYHPDTSPAPSSPDLVMLAYGVRIYTAVISQSLEMQKWETGQHSIDPKQSTPLQRMTLRPIMAPRVELLQNEVGRLKRRTGKSLSRPASSSPGKASIKEIPS